MKVFPVIFAVSLLANAAMLILSWTSPGRRTGPIAPAPSAAPTADRSQPSAQRHALALDPGASTAPADADTWRAFHSDDPAVLVARLRAAGFPPRVLHAIVGTVLDEQFLARREALLQDRPEPEYWKHGDKPVDNPETRAALSRLDRERDALMRELLGKDAHAGDELRAVYLKRRYGNLPPDKLHRLQDLVDAHSDLRAGIFSPDAPVTADEREKLAASDRELRAELARLLTREELEQYELRASPVASLLRQRLDAFQPTEPEYRAIFELSRSLEERHSLTGDVLDPQQLAARRAAEKDVDAKLRDLLGAERYADYVQAADPSQATLNQIARRFGLPLSAAREVADLQRSVSRRAREVRSNASLSAAEKDAQLLALQRDATARAGAVLTPRGLDTYKARGGSWLASLAAPAPGR